MISTDRYKKLNNNLSEYNLPEISAYIPAPTEIEYKRGYIQRYFVQKSNDINSYIFEVNKYNFASLQINPYFTIVAILWKISGKPDEIMDANSKSIKIGNKTIPSLHKYLQNTLQFSKQ
jgi:hypothetical protein